ncbi:MULTISPECIES: organic hydroperoxide resistance protein [Cupriavidus]|uniref:Organic hydroperoxide resistance protein n=2 Tax=Pseudomonadota TaxID=1224 RepID=A0A3G8H8S2_9BURK|nr:organic hydroperoxide resistance protein [Cupriavidus pauculus]AZG15982.1 organic hydroperoxide resistance protein [Cupriavidus pauculus]
MTRIEKVLYTGKVHVTSGGRDGSARSSDGKLDIQLSHFAGKGQGTNPEQLLAAGWSACFIGAIGIAASKAKVQLPQDLSVDTEVDLGTAGVEFLLQARLRVHIPGVDRDVARQLVETAHRTCPYSKALHGNVHIETELV